MSKALKYLDQHREIWLLFAILIVSTCLRLAFLHEPLNRDEGQYASIAQNILAGGLPYRDAIEIKPPGAFYLYAVGIAIFGATTEAIRAFTAVYALFTVIAVYGVARCLAGVRAGLCAAAVYGIFSTFPMIEGSGSNTEVFLVLPLTVGMWAVLKCADSAKRFYVVVAGTCAGIVLLIKPVALPVVALELCVVAYLGYAWEKSRGVWLNLAAFLLPILCCAGLTFGYFSLRGGLDDLWYWTVDFPRHYKASIMEGPPLGLALVIVASSLELPALFGIPAALWLAATRRDLKGTLPLLMLLAAWAAVALPGKYFQHYFITLMPFLAVPAGIALARIPAMSRTAAALTVLILLAASWFAVMTNYRLFTTFSPEEVSNFKYSEPAFAQSVAVAQYLREGSAPGDYIFQWGFEPELYFLADRRCPNPYLVSVLPGWSRQPQAALNRLQQSLMEKKPAFIVVQPAWSEMTGKNVVEGYLRANCREDRKIGYADIYRCAGR